MYNIRNSVNRICYRSQPVMSNKNVCMTTEHNNFLTVISKEDAVPNGGKFAKRCNFRFHSYKLQ